MNHENCTKPDGNKGCIDCVAYGANEEQERIIKLIEDEHLPEGSIHGVAVGVLIALIKGENK